MLHYKTSGGNVITNRKMTRIIAAQRNQIGKKILECRSSDECQLVGVSTRVVQ